MNNLTYNKSKFVVLHDGADTIHLVSYTAGATIYPGSQITQAEDFDDALEAIARVKELGGSVSDTRAFWPADKVPTERGGVLAWMDAPKLEPTPAA